MHCHMPIIMLCSCILFFNIHSGLKITIVPIAVHLSNRTRNDSEYDSGYHTEPQCVQNIDS